MRLGEHIGTTPTAARANPATYYGYPALKRPEWTWEIVLYFFLGGLAAGSYLVATLADIFGTERDRRIARAGRYLALAAIAVSPLLLIADLGRPERFSHMLRIFKTRSPMSMGTWGLTGFGAFVGLGALRQAVDDGWLSRRSLPARLLAFFVTSYTGVLLSFTNVPVWARNHLLQGPLFTTSALSSGLAAISLAMEVGHRRSGETPAWLGRAENAATFGELGLLAGALASLGRFSRPLSFGRYSAPFWLGAVGLGLVAPLLLRAGKPGRSSNIIASLCVLAGGLVYRWVTVEAGRASASNPATYLAYARPQAGRHGK